MRILFRYCIIGMMPEAKEGILPPPAKKAEESSPGMSKPIKKRRTFFNVSFLWGKIFHSNHLIQDTVHAMMPKTPVPIRFFQCLEEICYELDLEKPIWLDKNIEDFQRHSKTRFTQDNFIEHVDFDFLEIEVIEED